MAKYKVKGITTTKTIEAVQLRPDTRDEVRAFVEARKASGGRYVSDQSEIPWAELVTFSGDKFGVLALWYEEDGFQLAQENDWVVQEGRYFDIWTPDAFNKTFVLEG